MMRWRKLGRLFPADLGDGELPAWMGRYAALPVPLVTSSGGLRVFFSGRDANQRGVIGACRLDPDSLAPLPRSATATPLVTPGPLGTFDDSGCTVSCVVEHGGRQCLFYTGWSLGRTVPFHYAIGLAVSDDGEVFRKHSLAPLLGLHPVDPYLCASPWILREGSRWRMWYVSGVGWEETPAGPRHLYLVKHAESGDLLTWHRSDRICIELRRPQEYAIGRPCVLFDGGLYRMWYCARGEAYRIGYAESSDGLAWERRDEIAGIEPSASGWDSEMQAYPAVWKHDGRWLMLYNGNGYGATGFGAAEGQAP